MRSLITLLERGLREIHRAIGNRLDPYTATRLRQLNTTPPPPSVPDLVPLLLEIRRGVHALDEGHDPGRLPDLPDAALPVVAAYLAALEADTPDHVWTVQWRIGDVAHRYGIDRRAHSHRLRPTDDDHDPPLGEHPPLNTH